MYNKSNTKNSIIFLIFVFLVYMGTSFYINYTSQQAPVASDLPDQEKDMISLNRADDGMLSLTVPPTYVYGATQKDLDSIAAEAGYESITLNADGSATYRITEAQHAEMLAGVKEGIDQKLTEMAGSKNYSEIASIEHNDDYTDYTVKLSSLGGDESYSMATVTLKLYTSMYNAFQGVGHPAFHVKYYNKEGQLVAETK